jgi:hypothetical protein
MEFQMKVFVYFNLHKKCWSVKALEGPRKGRVVQHAKTIALHNVTFKVSEAGRQRVLREKKKNVHAGAVGTLDVYSYEPWLGLQGSVHDLTKVSYNPYKAGHFVNKETNEPVHTAQYAYLIDKTVMVK